MLRYWFATKKQSILIPQEVVYEPLSAEVLEQIENLVRSAIGIQANRGDTLTITSQPFVEDFEGFEIKWYETPWFRSTVENSLLVLLIGIVSLGVVRPMLNKILVPTASTNSVMELYAGSREYGLNLRRNVHKRQDAVEVDEGESLDDIKAKLKPQKRAGISADMLDTCKYI
jgi:flagellar M-ring protein FliF